MKFKVGDTVKVRADLADSEIYEGLYCSIEMSRHGGMPATVAAVLQDGNYILYGLSDWEFNDAMLEPIEPAKKERGYYTETVADTFKKVHVNLDHGIDFSKTTGVKHDQGKPDLSMIPYEALEEIAKVLMFGATKYDKNNWKKGINSTRLAGAALRHLGKWCDGVDIDSESSENHIAHAATNLLMLIWMLKHKPELDDRA